MKAPAHFFKFIPPALNSHLWIPKSFRKYLSKNKVATLRRGDQKWAVKISDDWAFGDGWDDFITDNDVQHFDIVVFKHQGNIVFDTMIFDTTWGEKEYLSNQATKSFRKQKLDNNALKKISKGKDAYIKQSTKTLLKADKKAKIHDQNHHPYFVSTLKQNPGASLALIIPNKFGIANRLSTGEMILKNVENKGSWTVYLTNNFNRCFRIQRGWLEFCTAIGLGNGDSFRFELIHNGKIPVAVVSRLPNAGLVNPYFRSIVTASSIKSACLNIPLPFARANKLDMKSCETFMMDEKQRRWPTRVCNSGGHVRLYGLRDMLVANEIKEGDEYLLELVDDGNKPLMNFHRYDSSQPGSLILP